MIAAKGGPGHPGPSARRVTVTPWPNGLGADVRAGRLCLEVMPMEHAGCGQAVRTVPDDSLCGSLSTHWARLRLGTFEEMAAEAVAAWERGWFISMLPDKE